MCRHYTSKGAMHKNRAKIMHIMRICRTKNVQIALDLHPILKRKFTHDFHMIPVYKYAYRSRATCEIRVIHLRIKIVRSYVKTM